MQNVRVVTDTVAGIPPNLVDEYGIEVIPVGNIYDDQWYLGGVTITPGEAYDLLRKDPDKLQTSAVAPGYLLDFLRDLETIVSAPRAFRGSASLRCFLPQASGV